MEVIQREMTSVIDVIDLPFQPAGQARKIRLQGTEEKDSHA
jgi:hypothetical protein